jgi:hypothetical protein
MGQGPAPASDVIPSVALPFLRSYGDVAAVVTDWAAGLYTGTRRLLAKSKDVTGSGYGKLWRSLTAPVASGGKGWAPDRAATATREFLRFMVRVRLNVVRYRSCAAIARNAE